MRKQSARLYAFLIAALFACIMLWIYTNVQNTKAPEPPPAFVREAPDANPDREKP